MGAPVVEVVDEHGAVLGGFLVSRCSGPSRSVFHSPLSYGGSTEVRTRVVVHADSRPPVETPRFTPRLESHLVAKRTVLNTVIGALERSDDDNGRRESTRRLLI